jgi:hypothetical protein
MFLVFVFLMGGFFIYLSLIIAFVYGIRKRHYQPNRLLVFIKRVSIVIFLLLYLNLTYLKYFSIFATIKNPVRNTVKDLFSLQNFQEIIFNRAFAAYFLITLLLSIIFMYFGIFLRNLFTKQKKKSHK